MKKSPLKNNLNKFELKLTFKSIPLDDCPSVKTSKDTYDLLRQIYDKDVIPLQEVFIALYFKATNRLIGWRVISIGHENSVMIDINLIIGIAVTTRASSVVLSHNHPSGSLQPSKADRVVTDNLDKVLKQINVILLDHIIVGPFDIYLSFADNGLL